MIMGIREIVILCAGGALVLAFTILCIAANVILDSFLVPSSRAWKKQPLSDPDETSDESSSQIKKNALKWLGETDHEDWWTESFDSLKLHALFYPQKLTSHKWVIVLHGWKGSLRNTCTYGCKYFEHGFNVLMVENRASGMSGGKAFGMGWLERKDNITWINEILSRDAGARIVLHGESMGAASVMMTIGENLPEQVKAAVSDCGYTSVRDEFFHVWRTFVKKPAFPILHLGTLFCGLRFHYTFGTASSVKQLRKSRTPILFLHGGDDNFVSVSMIRKNYIATRSKKDWFVIPRADHCGSQFANPDVYWNKVWDFISPEVNA